MKKFLRWMGGKHIFVKEIVSLIEDTPHFIFIEPFCGSAIVTLSKRRSKVEVINDRHNELINLFHVVRTRPEELIEFLHLELSSEYLFNEYKRTPIRRLGSVQRAKRFLYMNRLAFGGRVGMGGENGIHDTTWAIDTSGQAKFRASEERQILEKAHRRLEMVHISCRDYKALDVKSLNKPTTLWYVDPPYFGEADSRGYAGTIKFREFVKWITGLEGKVIFSHQEDTNIQKVFRSWHRITLGERLNAIAGVNTVKTKEYLFLNYVPQQSRRRFI